jgi:hypothetical protein
LPALILAACATAPKNPPPPLPPAAPPPIEASYDWHGLLLVPFGSLLREIPFTLHEVLLFRDAAQPAQTDEAECYGMEQTAPRFVARTPSEYLLCFKHDRLSRVQATVNLPQGEAAQIFSDACALWQRNAGAGQPGDCDGRDGGITYSGRLDQDDTQADSPLTLTLDSVVQP